MPLTSLEIIYTKNIFPQVNALDGLGQTALHRVAQQGNIQACRLLLSYAIDQSIRSLQGYTAADLATENIQKMLRGELRSLMIIQTRKNGKLVSPLTFSQV